MTEIHSGLYMGSVDDYKKYKGPISAVINLTRDTITSDIEVYDYFFPYQEFLPAEMHKMQSKLSTINRCIKDLIAHGYVVMIVCEDGKNKSPLVGTYYQIDSGAPLATAIFDMECKHFTPQQRKDELDDLAGKNDVHCIEELSPEDLAKWSQTEEKRRNRNKIRCLSFTTYKKLLLQSKK